jgi:mRNA-degrading endonuclease RelE of RelBE toxin-antitoxin system
VSRKPPKSGKAAAGASSPAPYEVDMTASAEAIYRDLYRKAKDAERRGDGSSAHVTTFNMVRDVVTRLIPSDPLNRGYALRGELSNIFRLRKGRLRICWIASSKLRRVCILFISETLRKEGDANDPYVIFRKIVDAGQLDSILRAVRRPPIQVAPAGHLRSPPRIETDWS